MNRDEIERILKSMADEPVEPLDDVDLLRLESRWRSAAGHHQHHVGSVVAFRRRRVLLASSAVLVAAAASVAVAVSLTREQTERVVVVADAEDIVIVLPTGEVVDPKPGEQLPEGAFVQAGPYGAGLIGGNTIRPDDLYRVVNGHLEAAVDAELMASTTASTAASPIVTSGQTQRSLPPATPATTMPQATEPDVTEPETTPATTDAPPPTVPETPTTVPTTKAARLKVAAGLDNGSVRLEWASSTDPAFRRYVVFRLRRWDGGGVPTRGRLATIPDAKQSGYVDEHPKASTVYLVVVIGADREVLAVGWVASPVKAQNGDTTDTTEPAATIAEPVEPTNPWGWPGH